MSRSDNLFDQATENVKPSVAPEKERMRQCGTCGYTGPQATMHQTAGNWFHDKDCLKVS